ncbi:MAG: glucose-1-phosphate adenylyltransferase [Magnetococcales bacterium]|nr:glucose-1-phosphate adenylyltransferase [Magnetococcales bacterium]
MSKSSLTLTDAIRNTLVVVLAGGRGSRLKQLTHVQAKPAVPFAGKFRIIDFALSNTVNSGFRQVGVLTQYHMHTLIQHVQAGWGFLRAEFNEFIQVWPAQQTMQTSEWYQGTADAVYQNIDIIEAHKPKYILILGGDHIYKQDYRILLEEHISRNADVSVCCVPVPRKEASGFGVMDVDETGRIAQFIEKPENPPTMPDDDTRSLASMGIYLFSADALTEQLRRDAVEAGSSHDFGKDLIPHMVPRLNVFAHRFTDSCVRRHKDDAPYWRDVGTVDAYWEANMDLVSVTPDLDLYDRDWPIWTYQRQYPAAKFVFDDDERRGMAVDSLVSGGCIVSGSVVRRSLLYSDVRVHSYCTIEDSILLPGCEVGRNCRLKKVIVGQNCTIPPNTVIGEDSVADAKHFFRTEEGVVLVSSDDLEKLADENG